MRLKNHDYPVCHLLYEEFPRDPRVRRYVNALNGSGINCLVICSKKKNERLFEKLNNNLIYRIPVSKKRQSFFFTFIEYLLFTSASSLLLSCLALKYKIKIVHVHTLPDFLVFAAWFNKLLGTKLVLDLHEIFPELFIARKPRLEKSFWVKLLKFGESLSVRFADKSITIHEPAKEIFLSRNKISSDRIQVIMNSVDPQDFRSVSLVQTENFIIMYNGTVVKLLNLQLIVRALALLSREIPARDFAKIRFRIFGDGPAVKELTDLSEELGLSQHVEYMGFVPPGIMHEEVLKANVCILPPLKNIYSDLFYTIKLIEMVYLGIPVIATRLNTYKKYYREESLFYFDSGDVGQLAERIREVFYNKILVAAKTKNAKEDYLKVGWGVMRERYLNLIYSL